MLTTSSTTSTTRHHGQAHCESYSAYIWVYLDGVQFIIADSCHDHEVLVIWCDKRILQGEFHLLLQFILTERLIGQLELSDVEGLFERTVPLLQAQDSAFLLYSHAVCWYIAKLIQNLMTRDMPQHVESIGFALLQ